MTILCGITWIARDGIEHRCAKLAGHPGPCVCHCGSQPQEREA